MWMLQAKLVRNGMRTCTCLNVCTTRVQSPPFCFRIPPLSLRISTPPLGVVCVCVCCVRVSTHDPKRGNREGRPGNEISGTSCCCDCCWWRTGTWQMIKKIDNRDSIFPPRRRLNTAGQEWTRDRWGKKSESCICPHGSCRLLANLRSMRRGEWRQEGHAHSPST